MTTLESRTRQIALGCLLLVSRALPAPARDETTVEVAGVVRDATGRPLARVRIERVSGPETTETDAQGAFSLALPEGSTLRASRGGYVASTYFVDPRGSHTGVVLILLALPRLDESVVVEAVRAADWVPVTTEDVGRDELERLDHGQEMPFLLKQTPSLTQYSDDGAEGGYSYLYLRGIPQTRLNLTLDGVPLTDAEDGAFYWVNLAGLAASLHSVQIQRGVGTSSFGAASFGGAVGLESATAAGGAPGLEGALGVGSLGTMRGSLGAHSGGFGSGFAAFARATYQETDGYRDHSGALQRSLALGISRATGRSLFKLFGLAGREQQQLAFYAADEDTLRTSLRENPLSPAERDRFAQGLVQAQYSYAFTAATHLTAQAYTNAADGWYRISADPEHSSLYEYGLDWRAVGGRVSVQQQRGRMDLSVGVFAQGFASTHTRDVVEGGRDYLNHGHKDEASVLAKAGFQAGRWRAYADAQVRHARFRYEGDQALGSVSWTFFNPRVGARWALSPPWSLYASVGRSTREPARSDLFAGEDNPTLPYDLGAVHPERVTDLEAGLDRRTERFSIQANLYFMEFRNEIAQTGELSEIGLPLRRNVDRSYRRGVELEAAFLPSPGWRFDTTISLNRSRIRSWTQYVDVYDASGDLVGSEPRTFAEVPPLLTPAFVGNVAAERRQGPFQVSASGRYVGRAPLDNTGSAASRTPGFFEADVTLRWSLKGIVRRGRPSLRVGVSNLFDNRRRWPSGYSYPFLDRDAQGRDTAGVVNYFYPLAGRTFFVGLEFLR